MVKRKESNVEKVGQFILELLNERPMFYSDIRNKISSQFQVSVDKADDMQNNAYKLRLKDKVCKLEGIKDEKRCSIWYLKGDINKAMTVLKSEGVRLKVEITEIDIIKLLPCVEKWLDAIPTFSHFGLFGKNGSPFVGKDTFDFEKTNEWYIMGGVREFKSLFDKWDRLKKESQVLWRKIDELEKTIIRKIERRYDLKVGIRPQHSFGTIEQLIEYNKKRAEFYRSKASYIGFDVVDLIMRYLFIACEDKLETLEPKITIYGLGKKDQVFSENISFTWNGERFIKEENGYKRMYSKGDEKKTVALSCYIFERYGSDYAYTSYRYLIAHVQRKWLQERFQVTGLTKEVHKFEEFAIGKLNELIEDEDLRKMAEFLYKMMKDAEKLRDRLYRKLNELHKKAEEEKKIEQMRKDKVKKYWNASDE